MANFKPCDFFFEKKKSKLYDAFSSDKSAIFSARYSNTVQEDAIIKTLLKKIRALGAKIKEICIKANLNFHDIAFMARHRHVYSFRVRANNRLAVTERVKLREIVHNLFENLMPYIWYMEISIRHQIYQLKIINL